MKPHPEPQLAAELAHREHEVDVRQAEQAGQGLGEFDKAEGKFDDTPPSGVGTHLTAAYQAAYRKANPDYAY